MGIDIKITYRYSLSIASPNAAQRQGERAMSTLTLELLDSEGNTHIAMLDREDEHVLGSYTWRICPSGYVRRRYDGNVIYLHRQIMAAPPDMQVDHINGNRADNRKTNLRLCTSAQNTQNSFVPKNNSTGFKGVSRRGGYWVARIGADGRLFFLGRFLDPREAAHAYNRAAIRLHGEFARLNPL